MLQVKLALLSSDTLNRSYKANQILHFDPRSLQVSACLSGPGGRLCLALNPKNCNLSEDSPNERSQPVLECVPLKTVQYFVWTSAFQMYSELKRGGRDLAEA